MRIFLVGYMGAGKTRLGKNLAINLNMNFIDVDDYISEKYGKSISDIFTEIGEDGFRNIETESIRELSNLKNIIISTGGGLPCFNENMNFLNSVGFSIFINTNIDVLFLRLKRNKDKRPLIANKSEKELKAFIESQLFNRMKYYNQASIEFKVDSEEADIIELSNFIKRYI